MPVGHHPCGDFKLAAESTGVKARRKLGLKIRCWSLHHKIVIEAIGTNGISWGEWITKERRASGNLRDRAKGALGGKGGNQVEGEVSGVTGCRRPSRVRTQKAARIW